MERDSLFGDHHRSMNRMINSFFGGGPFGGDFMNPASSSLLPFGGMGNPFGGFGMGMGMGMSPFGGFPNINQMMNMNDPNTHSFSSTSVMSVSSGPDGRPQVYHASSATRQAPGGVKETRKTLTDTRSGTKKMSVGRHLGERAHIREREDNLYTGQREENEDFVNLEEEEAPHFDREWRTRAYGNHSRNPNPALTHPAYNHNHRDRAQLQIQDRPYREHDQPAPAPRRAEGSRSRTSAAAATTTRGVTIEELSDDDNEIEEIIADTRRATVAPTPTPPPPTQPRARSSPSVPRASRRTPTQLGRDSSSRVTGKATKRSKRN